MGREKTQDSITEILSSKKYTKSNALVNAKGKAGLLAEKLFAVGIQRAVEDEKTGILTTTIRGIELKKIFQTNRGSFYADVSALVDPPTNDSPSLLDWRIIYKDDNSQTIEAMNVITDCSFKKGVFEIRFNSKITPQVRRLQANYTVFSLADTMPLKSIYSFKLYEILKSEYDKQDYVAKKEESWQPNAVYIMDMHIVDLKLRVGVIDSSWSSEISEELRKLEPNYDIIEKIVDEQLKNEGVIDKNKKTYKSYKRIDNFKKNVLDRARDELKEKTSIKFEYKNLTGGPGGKINGIRFFISRNTKDSDNIEISENPKEALSKEEKFEILDSIADIIGDSFSYKEIKIIAEKSEYNIEKVKSAYNVMRQSKTRIDNPIAWMISAIENNYQNKNNSFSNFKQNTYDFAKLEEQLLEN
jgi:plasmid replication initiation protein